MIINPNTLFTPVVSTGLIPMVRTNIKFNSEGIDYKYSLLGISQIEEKNLNKLKQILALFHNFPSMDINKPRLNKRLYEIDRVRQLTKGIDSQEWIESNLKSCSNQAIEVYNNIIMTNGVKLFTNSHMIENEKYGVFEFSLEDEATNLIPYIVFKYIATNLNDESLNVYYELQKDNRENSCSQVSNTPISKAEQLIIKIVTSEYIFIIKAKDTYIANYYNKTTSGEINIISISNNQLIIPNLIEHPFEIIKGALTDNLIWLTDRNYKDDFKPKERNFEFNKWFNSKINDKQRNLITICKSLLLYGCNGENRIELIKGKQSTYILLMALYKETVKNPSIFETAYNCIGFKWNIALDEKEESAVNLIIDRDFRYIYMFKDN